MTDFPSYVHGLPNLSGFEDAIAAAVGRRVDDLGQLPQTFDHRPGTGRAPLLRKFDQFLYETLMRQKI